MEMRSEKVQQEVVNATAVVLRFPNTAQNIR